MLTRFAIFALAFAAFASTRPASAVSEYRQAFWVAAYEILVLLNSSLGISALIEIMLLGAVTQSSEPVIDYTQGKQDIRPSFGGPYRILRLLNAPIKHPAILGGPI
jgi:hypothetical protein